MEGHLESLRRESPTDFRGGEIDTSLTQHTMSYSCGTLKWVTAIFRRVSIFKINALFFQSTPSQYIFKVNTLLIYF